MPPQMVQVRCRVLMTCNMHLLAFLASTTLEAVALAVKAQLTIFSVQFTCWCGWPCSSAHTRPWHPCLVSLHNTSKTYLMGLCLGKHCCITKLRIHRLHSHTSYLWPGHVDTWHTCQSLGRATYLVTDFGLLACKQRSCSFAYSHPPATIATVAALVQSLSCQVHCLAGAYVDDACSIRPLLIILVLCIQPAHLPAVMAAQ